MVDAAEFALAAVDCLAETLRHFALPFRPTAGLFARAFIELMDDMKLAS